MKASRGAIQSKLEELLELQDKYTAAQIDHGKTRSELDARRVHATREARDDGLDDAVDWIVENVP